jgi:hypothetical protein
MKPLPWILVFVACASLVACGSSSSSSQPSDDSGAPNDDAGVDTSPPSDAPIDETSSNDSGESGPSDVYPAPHPPLPTSKSHGGTVVAHPKIVPVVFDADPLAADIATFMSAWAGTTYWQTMLAEYGIDKPIALPVAHVSTAPAASITDDDIQAWLTTQTDGTHAGFPAPDANTLYALFYPPGVTINYAGLGASCTAFHGYHGATSPASGAPAIYSVISRCSGIPEAPVTGIQYVSAVASHEVIEGLTDPFVMSTPAFALTDDAHVAWELYPGGEVGDLCALVGGAFYQPSDFPYTVQRIWSNTAAASGHDPCIVQQPGQTYFNSAPVLTDDVRVVDNFGSTKTTKGVKLAIGETKTIEVDLFSDAPTDAWTVNAVEPFAPTPASHHLTLAWDRTTGQNGDKLHLTITALSKDSQFGGEFFMIVSKLGKQRTLWSVFVGQS